MSKILLIIFFIGLVAILFFIKKYEDNVEKRKEQLHNFKKCKHCGQEIKSYKILNICSNCARKQTSKLYKYTGITIIAISFFAGLILADTFKTEKIDDAYFKYSYSDENDVDVNRVGNAYYGYLPDKLELLKRLSNLYMRTAMFEILINSQASEHAARMSSMDNANRNARDMISSLTFKYNTLRQSAITTELTEIVAGAEAM